MTIRLLSIAICAFFAVLLIPAVSFAEESASSTDGVAVTTSASSTVTTDDGDEDDDAASSQSIAALLAKIKELTALFNKLKAQMIGVQGEISTLKSTLKADLKEGATDEDIKKVQELLASDPTIYPSGLKTGYFGPMTKEALMRFQEKNKLEVTGKLDEETRAALEAIMEERGMNGHGVGLLLAPGIKAKFEERLRTRCESSDDATCTKVKEKYKFEMKDGKMKVKTEVEVEKEDEDEDEEDETEDDDSDSDDIDDSDDVDDSDDDN